MSFLLEVNPLKNNYVLFLSLFLLLSVMIIGCGSASESAVAKNGDTVQVHYTGKLKDGTTFDSSINREPLKFTLGRGEMIPGFERAVLGMKVGKKKTIAIPASEAYGQPRKELIVEIPLKGFISDTPPEVGQKLQAKEANGNIIFATVTKVTDTAITLDGNHPLAGKDLIFEIELINIQ